MRLAIIGYGKMGKAVEKMALSRGHSVDFIIDCENSIREISKLQEQVDAAIEFTSPSSAPKNIYECLNNKISVVSGTTGWDVNSDEISGICKQNNVAMFYSSNFSIGMNIFMNISGRLAYLLSNFNDYSAKIDETHHIHKLDKPSGTSITLAEGIIDNNNKYKSWELNFASDIQNIEISSFREGEVIGDHRITWENDIDKIIIEHSAKNRTGFALGAVLAAEFVTGKTGFFTMHDLLNL